MAANVAFQTPDKPATRWQTLPAPTKFYFVCGATPGLGSITCLFHLTLKGLHSSLDHFSCTKPLAKAIKKNNFTNFALVKHAGFNLLKATDLVLLAIPVLGNIIFASSILNLRK